MKRSFPFDTGRVAVGLAAAMVLAACGGGNGAATSAAGAAVVTPIATTPTTSDPVLPTVPPVVPASLMPTVDRSKLLAAVPGYATERVQPTDEMAPDSDIGAFRTTCEFSHMSNDDPIVYPGQPGKAHLHVFFGNTLTDAYSTSASLHGSGDSTCRGGTVNRTAYWMPAIIDTKDGTPIKPLSMSVYYKTGYNGVQPQDVHAMPPGLRMIAGNPSATQPFTSTGRFNCDMPDGTNSGWAGSIPDCKPTTGLLMNIDFPQCWDGINMDSPDHKSHMAYANGSFITQAQLDARIAAGVNMPLPPGFQNNWGQQWWETITTTQGCPPTHPVALPAISLGLWYETPATAHEVLRWRLASDNYDPSQPAGYSVHADWFNGWKPDIVDAWIKGCDQAKKDCHSHLLGDGRMIY